MPMIDSVVFLLALTGCFPFQLTQSEHAHEVDVDCTYNTSFCSCPVEAEVCNFKLTIREALTFTKYIAEDVLTYKGKVWYVDEETGELEPIPPENDSNNNCPKDNSQTCTDANTLDGNTFRNIITVNAQFPGPTLQVHYNQIVSVEVTNLLTTEEISIHWHGIHQVNTNWMDGAPRITQAGIPPGSTFRYIFRANPAGTHWYHSHSGAQRIDGLFGALVVMEDSDTRDSVKTKISPFKDEPESHTLTFLDLQQVSSTQLVTQIRSKLRLFTGYTPPDNSSRITISMPGPDGVGFGGFPFWSGLINGKGRHPDIPYSKTILKVLDVDYSETYRFRLIGAQTTFAFRVSIDGHRMKVIATDGYLVNPVTVDFIVLSSGERYDFLLETKSTSETNNIQNFIIRGETLEVNEPDHSAEAILHYGPSVQFKTTDYEEIVSNSPRKSEKCKSIKTCTALNCPFKNYPPSYGIECLHVDSLRLLNPLPQDDDSIPYYEDDQKIFLNFAFDGVSGLSSVNSRNFKDPTAPLSLLNESEFSEVERNEVCKDLDGLQCDKAADYLVNDECDCVHMINVNHDESVQLVFSATGPNPKGGSFKNAHPVHLHGHSFYVVEIGFADYDENYTYISASDDIECSGEKTCSNAQWKNYPLQGMQGKIPNNTPLKDTVFLPPGGYVVAYMKSNNPGFWFLHCHMSDHVFEGMAVVINEGYDKHNPPPDGMRQWGNFNWTTDEFELKEAGISPAEVTTPASMDTTSSPTGGAFGLRSSYGFLVALLVAVLNF